MKASTPVVTPAERDRCLQQLSAARVFLLTRYPFFGHLLTKLRVVITYSVKTAAVSPDDRLFINPRWFDGLCEFKFRAFVLAHEVLHPALGIFFRMIGLDRRLTNEAHDYVINAILRSQDPEWLIPYCLYDAQYEGMAFEQVYAILADKPKSPGQGESGDEECEGGEQGRSGGGVGDDLRDADFAPGEQGEGECAAPRAPMTPEELARKRAEWEARVSEAAMVARSMGKVPAGLDVMLEATRPPPLPWEEKLRLAAADILNRFRVDWNYPSRRYCATGIYSPRTLQLGVDAAVYFDTSGSVSAAQLRRALGHLRDLVELGGGKLRLLQGDAEITSDEWIDQIPTGVKGGGGTSFVPLFDHLEKEQQNIRLLVIFTDTFGTMPARAPYGLDVIWAVYESALPQAKVDFGEIMAVSEAA